MRSFLLPDGSCAGRVFCLTIPGQFILRPGFLLAPAPFFRCRERSGRLYLFLSFRVFNYMEWEPGGCYFCAELDFRSEAGIANFSPFA
jgi:hypothetical protein